MRTADLKARFRPASGADIPLLGLGTFGSDSVTHEAVAEAVRFAVGIGYRHIDCAAVYGNESHIGGVLKSVFSGDAGYPAVKREDLWITSKLWNDKHKPADAEAAFKKSLSDLGLDYLDLFLVHWPFRNFHPPFCSVDSRSPDATPYIHEKFMETWQVLEKMADKGLVRHIGVSNVTVPKLKLILRDARIKPFCDEMELHPHFQQKELFDFVSSQGLVPIGYSPLGSPGRPERDKTPDDSVDMEDPIVAELARRRGVHPSSICLKWALGRGQIPIPFSVRPRNIEANLKASLSEPLGAEELEMLSGIDRNCRLIKGQVFLWEGAKDWEDLWDLNGEIVK